MEEEYSFETERSYQPTDFNSLLMWQVNRVNELASSKEPVLGAYYDAVDTLEDLLAGYTDQKYEDEIKGVNIKVEDYKKEFDKIMEPHLKSQFQQRILKATTRKKYRAITKLCRRQNLFPKGAISVRG